MASSPPVDDDRERRDDDDVDGVEPGALDGIRGRIAARRRRRNDGDDPSADLPTGRVRRAASVGRLAAGAAVREGTTRAANRVRSEERANAALARQQLETANQIVDVLGTMKGAAMKVGQVLSFLDFGLVDEEHREEFQRKLAGLRDMAPKVSFRDMRKVMERDLGVPLQELFSEFDEEPIGAASIGQVYRARLRERPAGWETDVAAVKVQYPGIGAAVRADMQNLGMLLRVAKSVAPGMNVQAVGDEIRERIHEELDYELEAANQRRIARAFRDHPFIVVPGVATELCGERVIVTEFVEGVGFEEWKARDQDERNRLAEIVFRFYMSTLLRERQFSADPHPGNSILMPDGRVAFLDFGLFRQISKELAENQKTSIRLGLARDGDGLREHMRRIRWIPEDNRYTPELMLELFDELTWWYTRDEEIRLTPEQATRMVIQATDPRSDYWGQVRRVTVPAEYLMGIRLEGLTMAVCSQLDASVNYSTIMREWLFDAEPRSELGRQEQAWLDARGGRRP
ncbi:MAG: AarF/ABC1/UbiB kinase family protein [Solirubrobacteraceae bacterium]|nr:AarF/ABC1/UbiB kinase family protein [Solirubrobacteraceae bacterium]